MSHRIEEKQARREARLRAEAEAARRERRNRLIRRGTTGAVIAIAAVLVTLAAVLGGDEKATPVASHEGSGSSQTASAEPGGTAPSFTLTNVVTGKPFSSQDLRGQKTMLFFSEGIGCQACMVQAAELERNKALSRAGIRLVSVTTDNAGDLAKAASQYGIHDPLLADPTTRMSQAYGMLGHGGMGHPTQDGHAFMLIGSNGKVLWHRAYQEMYVQPGKLLRDMRTEALRA